MIYLKTTKMSKVITPELINERLEAKGFGDKQMQDDESIREAVLKHYGYQFTDDWPHRNEAEYYIYEESTTDGYSVYIATANPDSISIGEDVHYYDTDLGDALADAIRYGNGGDDDYPETIYVDDLDANYIDEAMQSLFEELSVQFENEIIEQLKEQGYEYADAEAIA